jgi:ABC-2 type transport system permease protein
VFFSAVALLAVSSAFLGLFIAVAVAEVFEAQTLSNFFRFPMLFLCGLFFPISRLPVFLRPLSYVFPLTYGADALHGAVGGDNILPLALDLGSWGFSARAFLRQPVERAPEVDRLETCCTKEAP